MKLKFILSTFVLLLFAIIGGGSVDEDGNLAGWFKGLIVIFIVVFIIAAISGIKENKKKEEAAAIKRQQDEAARKAKLAAYNNDYKSFIATNGNRDKAIVLTPNLNKTPSQCHSNLRFRLMSPPGFLGHILQ